MSGRPATINVIPGEYALAVGRAEMPTPRGWVWVPLTDVARLESGHTPSREHPEYWDGSIPWIGIKDARAHHGGTIFETLQTVTADGIDNSAARILPAQTVCLSRTASVGYVVVMGREMATSQDFVNWVCGPGLEPHFLRHLLIAENASLFRFGKGSTHTTIYYPEVKAFHVCVPPRKEQRRIVAKLEALQARSRRAHEALDAVPPLLEKLRQSILAAAFRGDLTKDWRAKHKEVEPASKLLERIRAERRKKWEEAELAKMKAKGKTPKGDEWKAKYKEPEPVDAKGLPELPEGWCWAAWREVGFCQNGRAFPSAEYASEGVKLLRPGNLNVSGQLEWTEDNTRLMPSKWAEEFPEFVVGEEELLMNLTAQSLKDEFLGRICISGPGERCLLNQRIARLTPVVLPTAYWLWLFKSPDFRGYVDTLNTGSLIQHMFTSQVDSAAVPLMPFAEATQVVRILEAKLAVVRALGETARAQADRILDLDRSVLAKAFRGELVPQDPNDEPAEVMLARMGEANSATRNPGPSKREKKSANARGHATAGRPHVDDDNAVPVLAEEG